MLLHANGGKKFSYAKMRQLMYGTYLTKLSPSKYLGYHKVSAFWSISTFSAAVYARSELEGHVMHYLPALPARFHQHPFPKAGIFCIGLPIAITRNIQST